MGQYVLFKSHSQLFAMPINVVKRVLEVDSFITIPEVADYILGVYEFEDHMVPIIDLRQKLFGEATVDTTETKVILCSWKDQLLGVFVENILGISELEETNYEEQLAKANLKRGYIGSFLKYEQEVVISLELEYLFNNAEEEELLGNMDGLDSALAGKHSDDQ